MPAQNGARRQYTGYSNGENTGPENGITGKPNNMWNYTFPNEETFSERHDGRGVLYGQKSGP